MRTRLISSLAGAVLLFGACGGGSGGSQGEVVDLLMESAESEDIEVDRDCVEGIADELSDADAEAMVAAGVDGDADLSSEGEALVLEMAGCIDADAFIDSMLAEMGDEIDQDCAREALKDFDPADLAEGELPEGLFACVDLGG